ncbi:hypothetical protein MAJ_08110, partial [Metarhizium majus ARSEF 297]
MAQQTADFELIATAMHGNCVFSDAQHPANIQHLPGQAVVSVAENSTGTVHFPLGIMVDTGSVNVNSDSNYKPGLWLQVDCSQVEAQGGYGEPKCTEVVKAEVFIGCQLVWAKDFSIAKADPPKTQTFREFLGLEYIYQACMADGPKGLEVTLTLKYGRDSMRFCSVEVFEVVPRNTSQTR